MRISKHFFCFFLLCTIVGQSNAQEWTSYKSIQGVSDYLDMGDELYLATDAGLVIVDKNTLEHSNYRIEGSNFMTNHFVSVARSSSGETFIGTYDVVVARFDGSGFQDIIVPDGLNPLDDPKLYDLEISETGELWLATSQGVFRQLGEEWVKYNHEQLGGNFFKAWDIEFDAAGAVYIATGNGVYKFENESWTHLSAGISLAGYLDADVYFSKSGDLFYCSPLGGIGKFDGNSWTIISNVDLDFNDFLFNGFTEDLEGNIYVDTYLNVVFKVTGDSLTLFEEELNLGGNLPRTSFYHIDEEGVSWYNRSMFLSANNNGNIESTTLLSTTIESNHIYNVKKGPNGEMFFLMQSTTNSISVLYPNGEWSLLELPFDVFSWNASSGDMVYFGENDIWLSHYDGMYHYDGLEWTLYPLGYCETLVHDSQGRVYALGQSQIFILENGIISEYNTGNSELLPMYAVTAMGVDAEDNLWLGLQKGNVFSDVSYAIQKVSRAGAWTTYTNDDHPSIELPRGEFHFDINGNVWLPSSFGVIKFDGQNFTKLFMENATIYDTNISYSIESDATGKLYIATAVGMATLFEGEWEEMIIGDPGEIFLTPSVNLKFDDSGLLWYGHSVFGLYSFLPAGVTSTKEVAESRSTDLSIYPNPASDHATVAFSIDAGTEVNLSVFNKLGQQVGYKVLGYFNKGSYEADLELSDYPAGMYIVQLRLGAHTSIEKLIID
jgi:hypothetical protein